MDNRFKMGLLATWNVVGIDAPAIVTVIIVVELGAANGTEAIIRQVIPDPRDSCARWSRLQRKGILAYTTAIDAGILTVRP